ncbi:MAG: hypothetical protein ACI308_09385 [Muribaculaceae bacterium]
MKALKCILYSFVAMVFVLSTVLQFHHHDDDGSMCMCTHNDESVCIEHLSECDGASCHLSETHHQCADCDCSLHLGDTEVTSNNHSNFVENLSNLHVHPLMNAVLTVVQQVVLTQLATHASWPDVRCIGSVSKAHVNGCGLRAPPAMA